MCQCFESASVEEKEMHTLTFTLSPEGVIRVHDAVVCLSKFGESVSIEARHDKVRSHPVIKEINTMNADL